MAIKASVSPMSATCACAMTLAVALPPTRGCKITIELQNTIGNTANIPEANEPMLLLAVVTITTTAAAASARNGMSYRVRRNFRGAELRYRQLSGTVTAYTAALSASALNGVQSNS